MTNKSKIPDAETRVKNLAKLKEVVRQLDIVNLMLDEAIALADRDLLQQRRARLLYKSSSMQIDRIES
jgi:exonuclease VII small subunit